MRNADLKHAIKSLSIGSSLYRRKKSKQKKVLPDKKRKFRRKLFGWQRYMEVGKSKAESSMFKVESADQKLDAFYIICHCLFALHDQHMGENPEPETVMTAIYTWIEYLLYEEKSIEIALSKFKDSVENNNKGHKCCSVSVFGI